MNSTVTVVFDGLSELGISEHRAGYEIAMPMEKAGALIGSGDHIGICMSTENPGIGYVQIGRFRVEHHDPAVIKAE